MSQAQGRRFGFGMRRHHADWQSPLNRKRPRSFVSPSGSSFHLFGYLRQKFDSFQTAETASRQWRASYAYRTPRVLYGGRLRRARALLRSCPGESFLQGRERTTRANTSGSSTRAPARPDGSCGAPCHRRGGRCRPSSFDAIHPTQKERPATGSPIHPFLASLRARAFSRLSSLPDHHAPFIR